MSTLHAERHLPTGQLVQVRLGNLTEEDTDAIVNAANELLLNGAGVAGAILRRGGDIIQDECDAYTEAHGPVPTGRAVATGAGALAARYVIHAVGPIWDGGQRHEPELLRSAIRSSLEIASELGLASVAFPAISSGIFGFPKGQCAQVFLETLPAFFAEQPGSSVREVRLTNIDQETTEIFAQALRALE
ncbi:macro domain-containing protein [Chloroflexia bacterium SDU3-3]|nr:macro domain-containing protein [Chloroflexia bacterium SDU3-3]